VIVYFIVLFLGKKYPAYVESIPVQFVPHSGEGQLKVLLLDDKEEHLSDQKIENQEDDEKEEEESSDEDYDIDSDSKGYSDELDDGMKENDDTDDTDDDDKDKVHKGRYNKTRKTKTISPKKKPKAETKVIPSVNEIKCNNLENGSGKSHAYYLLNECF
jgi:hypothetical protein